MALLLRERLTRHLGQRTVLGIAIPVIEGTLAYRGEPLTYPGLSEKQIEQRFRDLACTFNGSDYHSTYLHRRLGPRGFLVEEKGLYRLQPRLLDGCGRKDLEEVLALLISSVKSDYERRQEMISRLERTANLPANDVEGRKAIVTEFLSALIGNRGEAFEVTSFAILREYFRVLGFSLSVSRRLTQTMEAWISLQGKRSIK